MLSASTSEGGCSVSVKFGLLALLAEAPTHGYQLKTDFERRTANQWALNIGQVYTTLQRLERDGLVEAIGTDGDRNEYRITPDGRRQLDEWFVSPVVPGGAAARRADDQGPAGGGRRRPGRHRGAAAAADGIGRAAAGVHPAQGAGGPGRRTSRS